MKFLTILIAFIGIVAITALPLAEIEGEEHLRDLFGDIINKTLNDYLGNVSDPLTLDDINQNFDDAGTITGSLSVTGLSLGGIKNLVATNITVNMLTQPSSIEMEIHVSSFSVKFDYNVDLVVVEIAPVYGSGSNSLDASDISLAVTSNADLSQVTSGSVTLSDTSVLLSVGSANFNLNGLFNNEELSALISEALNDNLVEFINTHQKSIAKIIGEAIESIINSI